MTTRLRWMRSMLEFVYILLIGLFLVTLYSLYKYRSVRNWKDWLIALVAVLALGSFFNYAKADTFQYTEIYFGLEHPLPRTPSPQCQNDDDQWISNIGVNQHLITWGDVDLTAIYRHHSCVVGDDKDVTDMLGIKATWKIQW